MMKGDSYSLPIAIDTADGRATPAIFDDIEVCLGRNLRKTLSAGEIGYDEDRLLFLVPLTQEETFALSLKTKVVLRCKGKDGTVVGIDLGVLEFAPTLSKEVL